MELKHYDIFKNYYANKLLIVPYGIETNNVAGGVNTSVNLLIVPYGIETCFCMASSWSLFLLIVPYGIETYSDGEGEGAGDLLIVPYGIET